VYLQTCTIRSRRLLVGEIALHNGGETLLHPRLSAMLEVIAAKRAGRTSFPVVSLLTNGVLLNEAKSNAILSSGAVDVLRVSVDVPSAMPHGCSSKRPPSISPNSGQEKNAVAAECAATEPFPSSLMNRSDRRAAPPRGQSPWRRRRRSHRSNSDCGR
jgi:hypothetical protein